MTLPHILLFLFAGVGIVETIYLISSRRNNQKPICVTGQNTCHFVLESKYNKTFGVHNDILGLIFYVVLTLLTGLVVSETTQYALWHALSKILIAIGLILSAYFTFLQWKVIKKWCFWCLMSATTVVLMSVVVVGYDFTL